MALSAKELEQDAHLRVLLMGAPKVGKTSMTIKTSPQPVRVLLCESDSALTHAVRVAGSGFTFDRVKDFNSMISLVREAREDAENGKIKTVVVDPFSDFVTVLEEQCLKSTDTGRGPDGRRAYPELNRRLRHVLDQMFRIPAHLIVITHYIDVGGGEVQPDDGGEATPRVGEGYVPLLPGKARALVAARFPDVVFMRYDKGERVLETGPRGAWGPGCRSLPDTQVLPADITKGGAVGIAALLKAIANVGGSLKSSPSVSASSGSTRGSVRATSNSPRR